jgi:hypothetical protein
MIYDEIQSVSRRRAEMMGWQTYSTLDGLDADGLLVDTEDASTLARSRANATGEL